MDDLVLAAIAKWPNVPAVYGWLGLTARGEWRLKGQRIDNPAIRAFIGRNYAADEARRWFFQNGPQRVFVELALAPWIYRVAPDGRVATHTGATPQRCTGAALLDDGRLVLVTDLGCGNIDDRDTAIALRAVTDNAGLVLNERGIERWLDGKDEAFIEPRLLHLAGEPRRIERLKADDLPTRYGFQREPKPDEAKGN